MTPQELVLLVEGEGDVDAVPILAKKALASIPDWWNALHIGVPMQVGGFPALEKDAFAAWKRLLKYAAKRSPGACLVVLDGDAKHCRFAGTPFCSVSAARRMVEESRTIGAGAVFSLAVVFARCEFESWLIAGSDPLVGKTLADGRVWFPEPIESPSDLESAPRDAKGWLSSALGKIRQTSYRPARDQAVLAKSVDLDAIRSKNLTSFARFERSLAQLVEAVRTGTHVATPPP